MEKKLPDDENIEKSTDDVNIEKTVEELQAELAKAKGIQEDKHNFALKTESEKKKLVEELETFKEAERLREEKKLEEAWEFETLKASLSKEKELYKSRTEEVETNNTKLAEENSALITMFEDSILAKLPEDKREWVKTVVKAYKWKERIDQLENLVKMMWVEASPSTFWGDIKAKKPKELSTIESLEEKVMNKTATWAEMNEYKSLINK